MRRPAKRPLWFADGRSVKPEDSPEESGSHPDTGSRRERRSIRMFVHVGMKGGRVMRPVDWGCSLKSVE